MINIFGLIVFYTWPLVVFWLTKKYKLKKSIFLSMLLASIIVPAYSVDFPLIPPLDRGGLTSLALLLVIFIHNQRVKIFKGGVFNLFLIGYLFAVVVSSIINSEPMIMGGVYIQESKPYDAFSNVIQALLAFMPFFIGRRFLNDLDDTRYMFTVMTVCALIYSIPMLLEVKLSPQMHNMFYGFSPADFIQQIRSGGFRPAVFMGHGLPLAIWFSICIIGAIALLRNKVRVPMFSGLKMLVYLLIVLILCKTFAAVIYVVLAATLMFFFKNKKQLLASLVLTMLVMVYPLNSTSQYINNDDIVDYVESYNPDRAQSLEFRLDNERLVIKKALERPYFGWAGYGRNKVYKYGKDISIIDGQWLIVLSTYGIVGFIFYYLLLTYPIWLALRNYKYIEDKKHRVYFSTLAIMLAIGNINSVPNGAMLPIHLLLGGALLGQAELLRSKQKSNRKRVAFNN